MIFVLDTSILIDICNKKEDTLKKLKELTNNSIPKITFINDFEFRFGLKNKNERNQLKLLGFINNFPPINTTLATSIILSNLKSKYE